jgi:ribose 1,5-bisphosphokinase PhnN
MSPKLETLSQLTHSLQSLVAELDSPDQAYIGVKQSLKETSESLQAGRLTLQIVGQDVSQAKKLQKILEVHSGLEVNYQFRAAAIPPIPTLILQSSLATNILPQYQLETPHNQTIGRSPSSQLVLPNSFHLTSSNHAEFRLLDHNWQIRDTGSSNGTFVNDDANRLQDWYSLQTGDRICLGSPLQAEGSANFTIDISTSSEHQSGVNITKILDCNIICLIVPPQPLPESFQYLLKTAKTSEISKFFIVIEHSENVDSDEFTTIVSQIDSSVKYQLQGVPYGIFALVLDDHIADSTVTSRHLRPDLDNFYNSLKNLSVLGTEEILAKWAANRLSETIDKTEDVLLKSRNITNKKLPNENSLIQDSAHLDSRRDFDKIYKRVTNESSNFFRQIKIEVNQSKSNFLDEFKQNSIGQKIQEFTKPLQPQIITKGEYRNIYLRTGPEVSHNNVHEALIDLCHTEIAKWATEEWESITNEYAGGGISFFFEDSFDKLSLIPEVSIPKKDFSSTQKLNTQSILNTSSVEPDLHSKYRKIGFFEYLLKNGKSHVFGSVTLTLIVTFLFKSVEQSGANAVRSDIEIKIFYLILFLVPFTISVLWFNHKQDKDMRLKESTDKLKKDSNAYYRSYTEWLVEKLIQRIDISMSAEERRFQETLENVQEIYDSYFTTQIQAKSQQDHKIEQTKVIEYLNRLHHLKKLIQS